MNANFSWYVRGDGNKPAGPFSAAQIIDSLRTGRLDPDTICWREGMPQWLPLAHVEPFAMVARSNVAKSTVMTPVAILGVVIAALLISLIVLSPIIFRLAEFYFGTIRDDAGM